MIDRKKFGIVKEREKLVQQLKHQFGSVRSSKKCSVQSEFCCRQNFFSVGVYNTNNKIAVDVLVFEILGIER